MEACDLTNGTVYNNWLILSSFSIASLKWSKEPQDLSLKQGGEANISCEAEGYPEPIIFWKRLNSSNELSLYDNRLHMLSATAHDAGNYECIAKNSEGDSLSKIVSVSVIGESLLRYFEHCAIEMLKCFRPVCGAVRYVQKSE